MILSRCLGLMVALTLLALLVAHIRGETVRANHRANVAHLQALAVRRDLWHAQLELATLRTPAQIKARVTSMQLAVVPAPVELPADLKPIKPTKVAAAGRAVDRPVDPNRRSGRH